MALNTNVYNELFGYDSDDRGDSGAEEKMPLGSCQSDMVEQYTSDDHQDSTSPYQDSHLEGPMQPYFGTHLQAPAPRYQGNPLQEFFQALQPYGSNPLQEQLQQYDGYSVQVNILGLHGHHVQAPTPYVAPHASTSYTTGRIEELIDMPDEQVSVVKKTFAKGHTNAPKRVTHSHPNRDRTPSYPAAAYHATTPPPMQVGRVFALSSNPPPAAETIGGSGAAYSRIHGESRNYGDLLKGRPPLNVLPPGGMDIGMIEICTFFPSWFQIPDVSMRAISNGWTRQDIIKAQLHAAGLLNEANLLQGEGRIQKQISECGKLYVGLAKNVTWSSRYITDKWDDLTANDWGQKGHYDSRKRMQTFGHIKLRDVYMCKDEDGEYVELAEWPKCQDRLLLTDCLAYAARHPELDLDTSHFGWIANQLFFTPVGHLNHRHDEEARNRLKASVPTPKAPKKEEEEEVKEEAQ